MERTTDEVEATREYHPYIWMGEEQDDHVKKFNELSAAAKAAACAVSAKVGWHPPETPDMKRFPLKPVEATTSAVVTSLAAQPKREIRYVCSITGASACTEYVSIITAREWRDIQIRKP